MCVFYGWEQDLYAKGDCVLMAAVIKASILERETFKNKRGRQD